MPLLITDDQREEFEARGYLIVDPEFEPGVVEGIVAEMEPVYDTPTAVEGRRIQDAWKFNENVRRVALHQPILETLELLYGRKPLPFQTLNFNIGTEQRALETTGFHVWCLGGVRRHRHGLWASRLLRGKPQAARGDARGRRRHCRCVQLPEVRGLHREFDRGSRGRDAREGVGRAGVRTSPEGPSAHLVSEPPSRWLAQARRAPNSAQPGHALLLRGLPLLHADVEHGVGDPLAEPRMDHSRGAEARSRCAHPGSEGCGCAQGTAGL